MRWLTGGFSSSHRDGAGTRSRGRLRYLVRLDYMRAAPLPVFWTRAKAGIDGVHQRVEAATMQILVVANEVFVRFRLPQGDHLHRQALVDFV
jgi:hypothetical protein